VSKTTDKAGLRIEANRSVKKNTTSDEASARPRLGTKSEDWWGETRLYRDAAGGSLGL